MVQLTASYRVVFGLGFDVEIAPNKKSGVQPVTVDERTGKHFFGDLRLEGFAALLELGFAGHLVIVSGEDYLYGSEPRVIIHEAELIRKMLIEDFGIPQEKISVVKSDPHSSGNIKAIKEVIVLSSIALGHYASVSNHYHIPRFSLDINAGDLQGLPSYPAEAFLLLKDELRKSEIVTRLGGGPLAERVVEEIQGVAHRLRGTYKPLTADFGKK